MEWLHGSIGFATPHSSSNPPLQWARLIRRSPGANHSDHVFGDIAGSVARARGAADAGNPTLAFKVYARASVRQGCNRRDTVVRFESSHSMRSGEKVDL